MEEHNLLERLVAVSPGMEIWWDSSPVIFEAGAARCSPRQTPADRETLKRQFGRMYGQAKPEGAALPRRHDQSCLVHGGDQ